MRSKAQTKKKQEEMVFIPGTRRVPGIWDVVVVVVVVVFVVVLLFLLLSSRYYVLGGSI